MSDAQMIQRKAHLGKEGPKPRHSQSLMAAPGNCEFPGVVFLVLLCACCSPTNADDWEKYNQPGQQERRTSNEDMQRAAIDKVQNRIQNCVVEGLYYQKAMQARVEAHTKRPQPLDFYHEAYDKCMSVKSKEKP